MKTLKTSLLAALLWVGCSVATANASLAQVKNAANEVAHEVKPAPPSTRKKAATAAKTSTTTDKPSVYAVGQNETLDQVIKKSKTKSPFKLGILREAFLQANPGVLSKESGQSLEPGMVLNVPTDRAVVDLVLGAAPVKLLEADAVKAVPQAGHGSDHAAVATPEATPAVADDAHGAASAVPLSASNSRPAPIRSRVNLAAAPSAEVHVAAATEAPSHENPALPTIGLANECGTPLKTEIAALFDRWNASLKSGDAKKVVANYATPSILLPTVSNKARFTAAEKEEYFVHFLQRKPEGKIDDRMIEVDCNSATDAGFYSFKFADGSIVKARYSFAYKKVADEWLISSHHSSGMPEKTEALHAHDSRPPSAAVAVRDEPAQKSGGWVRFP